MNSQNQEHQKNNFKNVSKSTIIYLGTLATMFVNTTVANEIVREDQDQNFNQVATLSNFDTRVSIFETTLRKPEVISESEINFTDLVTQSAKLIEEIIEEDKKITEFQDEVYQPLYTDTTSEEAIKENNQIIESELINEVFPLNFELIKKIENALKNEAFKNPTFDTTTLKS